MDASEMADDIGGRQDADGLKPTGAILGHHQAMDVVAEHNGDSLFQARFWANMEDVPGHDIGGYLCAQVFTIVAQDVHMGDDAADLASIAGDDDGSNVAVPKDADHVPQIGRLMAGNDSPVHGMGHRIF